MSDTARETAEARGAIRVQDAPTETFIGIYATHDSCKIAVHMSRAGGGPAALAYLDEFDTDGVLPAEIGNMINSVFAESGKIYMDCTENPQIGQDLEDIVGSNLLEQTRFGSSRYNRLELMRIIKSAMDSGYTLPDRNIMEDARMKRLTRQVQEEIFQESSPGGGMAHLKKNTLILAVALSLKAAHERPGISPVPESARVSGAITKSANHIAAAIVRCLPPKIEPASVQYIQSKTIQALVSLENRAEFAACDMHETVSETMALIMDNFVRHVDLVDPASALRIQNNIMPHLRTRFESARKKGRRRRRAASKAATRQSTKPAKAPDSTAS